MSIIYKEDNNGIDFNKIHEILVAAFDGRPFHEAELIKKAFLGSSKVVNMVLLGAASKSGLISKEELKTISNKIELSKNKTSEEIFMNSVDMTEGCGLGIIMIKKIMEQISNLENSFSIYADDQDTITELRINMM